FRDLVIDGLCPLPGADSLWNWRLLSWAARHYGRLGDEHGDGPNRCGKHRLANWRVERCIAPGFQQVVPCDRDTYCGDRCFGIREQPCLKRSCGGIVSSTMARNVRKAGSSVVETLRTFGVYTVYE